MKTYLCITSNYPELYIDALNADMAIQILINSFPNYGKFISLFVVKN